MSASSPSLSPSPEASPAAALAMPPLWTRNFILLWGVTFLVALSFYFLLPSVPAFAAQKLGARPGEIGYIIGVFTLAAVVIRPAGGYAVDAYGRGPIFLGAAMAITLAVSGYLFAASLTGLFVLRVLHGLAWGGYTTAGGTLVADLVPAARRGEGLGWYGMAMTLAMALGPMLGSLVGGGDHQRTFAGALVLALLAALLATRIRPPDSPRIRRAIQLKAFFEPGVLSVCWVTLFSTLVYGGIVSFLPLFTQEIGVKNPGWFFAAYAGALTLVRPSSGRFFDRHGPTAIMVSGLTLLALGFLVMAQARGLPLLLGAAALMGVGNGMVWPIMGAMVINMVPPQRRGVANSTYFSFIDIGIGGGSVLLGKLAEATSLRAMFVASAVILIIPLAYYLSRGRQAYQKAIQQQVADALSHNAS